MGPLTYVNHLLLGLAIGFAFGGKILRIGTLPVRFAPFVLVLLAARVFLTSDTVRSSTSENWIGWLLLLLVAAMVALLWANRHIAGVPLMTLGIVLNLLVMGVNGGFMPVLVSDLVAVGASPILADAQASGRIGHSIALTEATALPWLADRIVLPAFLVAPAIFSLGDVLIGFGFSYLVASAMLDLPAGLRRVRTWRRQAAKRAIVSRHVGNKAAGTERTIPQPEYIE